MKLNMDSIDLFPNDFLLAFITPLPMLRYDRCRSRSSTRTTLDTRITRQPGVGRTNEGLDVAFLTGPVRSSNDVMEQ